MIKRTFLKLSSVAVTGTMLAPLTSWWQREQLTNWAGNYIYSTNKLTNAASIEEVKNSVRKMEKLKVLGSRHCFNGIADSKDNLLTLTRQPETIEINSQAHSVTVGAGIKYGVLAEYLHRNGFALHNLASLPHISVAGACVTATHGSGSKNGNLSTPVSAMEMVMAKGDVVVLSREKDGEAFNAMVVNLGGAGVITKLTLNIEPTYQVRQDVYENLAMPQLADHFNEIMAAGYSVSLFTDWRNKNFSEVWIKKRVTDGTSIVPSSEFYGATAASKNLHPIVEISPENCTEQMGVPGPWHERLPHFKMGFTPSSGKELQSEYFVAREHAYEAITAVQRLSAHVSPLLLISEIRTIDADNFWMSPCYRQPSTALHFTWKPDWPAVKKVLPLIEKQLAPFNARPHWGKLFTMPPAKLRSLYAKLPEFQQLLRHHDPGGKFRNAFLDTYVYNS